MMPGLSWRALAELAGRAWSATADAFAEAVAREDWLSPEGVRSLVRLAQPVAPFNWPEFAAPAIGLAGALLTLVLLGVAVSSLSTLLVALLALALVLTRVFGVSLELVALGPGR